MNMLMLNRLCVYRSLFCIALGLMCGAIGVWGATIFVRKIYHNVKID